MRQIRLNIHRNCGRTASINKGQKQRAGFSLLEVILALAILTTGVALLGELTRYGIDNAMSASELTQAQILCESKMNELVAGLITLGDVAESTYESATGEQDLDWSYSIITANTATEGLWIVEVRVTKIAENDPTPTSFSLYRWIRDPNYIPEVEDDEESEEDESTTRLNFPVDFDRVDGGGSYA